MTDKCILISDLNDISDILNNNGYVGWCKVIQNAIAMLKEQEAEIEQLRGYINGFSKDAVPVVRCKDCKKWHTDCLPNCGRHGCDVIGDYTKPDDFCSFAERRECR